MELLTVKETASLLKVAPVTVRRYIAGGRLPVVRIGGIVRVEMQSVQDLLLSPDRDDAHFAEEASGKPLTYDDALWQIVGSATNAPASDASKKHDYLSEGWSREQA